MLAFLILINVIETDNPMGWFIFLVGWKLIDILTEE
jgi:hypothetical protein